MATTAFAIPNHSGDAKENDGNTEFCGSERIARLRAAEDVIEQGVTAWTAAPRRIGPLIRERGGIAAEY